MLFGLEPQPVRNARAVQRLAEQLKEKSVDWFAATESLLSQLQRHTEMLELDEEAPRLRTANITYDLLGQIRGQTEDSTLITALARADLPGDAAVYKVSMETAANVAAALDGAHWKFLRTLEKIAKGAGEHAPEARRLLQELRTVARHNEQQKKLATALDQITGEAIALIEKSVDPSTPGGEKKDDFSGPRPVTPPPPPSYTNAETTIRVSPGEDPAAAVANLRSRLNIPEDTELEIIVRVVRR